VNGWKFATQYLRTGYTFATGTCSILARFSDVTNANTRLYGEIGTRIEMLPNHTAAGGVQFRYSTGAAATVAPAITAGVVGQVKNVLYVNGANIGSSTLGGYGAPQELWIGCANNGGAPLGYTAGYIQAMVLYNANLTDAQMLAVSTAMAAL
jgi:hypothetical protein